MVSHPVSEILAGVADTEAHQGAERSARSGDSTNAFSQKAWGH